MARFESSIKSALDSLTDEKAKIEKAIIHLQNIAQDIAAISVEQIEVEKTGSIRSRGITPQKIKGGIKIKRGPGRPRKSGWTHAKRMEVSKRMSAYWAARRAGKAQSQGIIQGSDDSSNNIQ